jgi:DNA-binding SARP family transcriptional activator
LQRARLFELLDAHADRPALWICGPPGAGKTTLVATWLDHGAAPALWYHADPGDRDPGGFFAYLAELARSASESTGRGLPVFGPEHERDTSAFARLFFRRFFAVLPAGAALVIDNHHDAAGSAFDALLRDALGEVPPGRRLVVVSRSEVPPSLSRALANQSIGRIGWDDLRLTPAESEQLLSDRTSVHPSHAAELHRVCGGWVAGLVLMASSTRTFPALDAESEGAALFEYFAFEVFEAIPEADRSVLLATAAFPQFTAEMAVAISGQESAVALLDRLTERQYFTERRVAQESAFRYHDLFRDYLRAQAVRTFGVTAWHGTLERAATILFDRGDADAAIECLGAAENWPAVGAAVALHARPLLAKGRWRTVLGWLDQIPVATLESNPWLLYWRGSARAGSDPPGGRSILEKAFAAFGTAGDAAGQLSSCAAILQSFFSEWNTGASMEVWIEATERLLSVDAAMRPGVREAALPALVHAMLVRMPTNPRLPEYAREVERNVQLALDPNERLSMAVTLMYYFDEMGEFDRSGAAFERIEPDLARDDALPINRCFGWYRRSYHAYFRSDFDAAREAQLKSIHIAREFGLGELEYVTRVSQAMTLLANGEVAAMRQLRNELLRVLIPQVHQHAIAFQWLDLWSALVSEDLGEARRVWDGFSRLPPAGVPIYTKYNQAVVWLLCIEGKAAVALDRVAAWRRPLAQLDNDWTEFNFLAMEACAYLHLPDEKRADAALHAMMTIGRRHHYSNLATWIPRMASELCAAAWARGIETEYVRWLVSSRGLDPPEPDTPDWPRAIEVRTLGTFAINLHGRAADFGQKTPRRPLALLKAVVSAGPAGLSTERARALLWTELEGDAAAEALAAALHRLRKVLGDPNALRLNDGRITIDDRMVWIDALAFERLAGHADERAQRQALELYRGPYLPLDETENWSIAMRDRLRARFATLVTRRALGLEQTSRFEEAIACYHAGIGAEPLAETLYQGLMRCHLALGRRAEGASVYRQLRQTLSVILGISPSAQSESLGKALLAPD